MTKAVEINGVRYPSQRAAADALGISPTALAQRLARGLPIAPVGVSDATMQAGLERQCREVLARYVALLGRHKVRALLEAVSERGGAGGRCDISTTLVRGEQLRLLMLSLGRDGLKRLIAVCG